MTTETMTTNQALRAVFAGDSETFDHAAVKVAEDLVSLAESIREWVVTPGNHGGNPYRHQFARTATELLDEFEKEG